MESKTMDTTDGQIYKDYDGSAESSREKILSIPTREDTYDVTHHNVGYACILNQINFDDGKKSRDGSEKDGTDLEDVLTEIGFTVEHFLDLTTKEIREKLKTLSEADHSKNDCLLITIMTHGGRNGVIYSKDGQLNVNEVYEYFIGDKCESMIGKPKIFFIQACRGQLTDVGTKFKTKSSESQASHLKVDSEVYVIPLTSDILIHYSTSHGFYSVRDRSKGSWFIQSMCKELRNASGREICEILSSVNRGIAFENEADLEEGYTKQAPVFQSSLTKKFYLSKKNFEMKVMPINYPEAKLDDEGVKTLEKNLISKIDSIEIGNFVPSFQAPKFHAGYWKISCLNGDTVDWLQNAVNGMKIQEVSIKVTPVKELLAKIVVGVFIPDEDFLTDQKVFSRFSKQNDNMDVKSWRIVMSKREDNSRYVEIEISKESYELLMKKKLLSYGFEKVKFHVMSDGTKKRATL